MKKIGIGVLLGIILGGLMTGYTLIRTAHVESTDYGYTVTVFGHDFEYR